MVEQIIKVENSKGYKVIFETLNEFFNQSYEVKGIICGQDLTSLDFTATIDLPNLKGVDISVGGSGSRQMFRVGGNGTIGIRVPKEDGIFKLASGLRGDSLYYALPNKTIKFGPSVDSPEDINKYFTLFKEYYNKYC